MTNFEKIKQMSVEGFIHIMLHSTEFCKAIAIGEKAVSCKKNDWVDGLSPCQQCLKQWLESEADTEQREGERE